MEIIDLVFFLIISTLENIKDTLEQASIIAAQGLNIEYYLGYIAPLGENWLNLVQHVFYCSLIIVIILITKSGWTLYLKIKDSVKWW